MGGLTVDRTYWGESLNSGSLPRRVLPRWSADLVMASAANERQEHQDILITFSCILGPFPVFSIHRKNTSLRVSPWWIQSLDPQTGATDRVPKVAFSVYKSR